MNKDIFLVLAVSFGCYYQILLFRNRGGGRGGIIYFAYLLNALVYVFLSTHNFLWVLIAIPLLMIGQLILSIVVGLIKRLLISLKLL